MYGLHCIACAWWLTMWTSPLKTCAASDMKPLVVAHSHFQPSNAKCIHRAKGHSDQMNPVVSLIVISPIASVVTHLSLVSPNLLLETELWLILSLKCIWLITWYKCFVCTNTAIYVRKNSHNTLNPWIGCCLYLLTVIYKLVLGYVPHPSVIHIYRSGTLQYSSSISVEKQFWRYS